MVALRIQVMKKINSKYFFSKKLAINCQIVDK